MTQGISGSGRTANSPIQTGSSAANRILTHIFNGQELIISHGGSSQYQGGGISACGLAALNCVRVILGKEQRGIRADKLLEEVASQYTAEEITSICAQWSGSSHLEVEEILRVPIFRKSLSLNASHYAQPGPETFRVLLNKLQTASPKNISAAVVITRPPEIIACLKIATSIQDVFVIFDSHPRPSYPAGAGFIFNTSVGATAERLSTLLSVDSRLLADRGMQWQAQLLGNFSGHVLVARPGEYGVPALTQTILESSLKILELQSIIAKMRYDGDELAAQNAHLEGQLEGLRSELSSAREKVRSLENPASKRREEPPYSRAWYSSWPLLGSSSAEDKSYSRNKHRYDTRSSGSVSSRRTTTPPRTPSQTPKSYPPDTKDDHALAEQLQMELNSAGIRDVRLAAELQRQFETEDRQIMTEREELSKLIQRTFSCVICLDKYPEDDIARIQPCGHSLCRDCMRGHIITKLQDHRFPILCPICVTEKGSEPSILSDSLIQQVGIPEKEYQILEELQLVAFSILLHCRKCQKSVFVDREEYQESKLLSCPLPGCTYTWCKTCQQTIEPGGPQHSCDGTNELEHLMKLRGWKHCPGCQTPIQKESGCNHMTCMSPGCNTHFCYRCGETIVVSALPMEINRETSAHYRRCSLFEEIPDRPVPP